MTGKATLKVGRCIIAEKPKRYRTDWKPSRMLMRIREVEKVIRARHGSVVPDPEDTDDRSTCLAYARAAALALSGQDMHEWAAKWTPWARPGEIQPFIAEAAKRRHMMSADGAAGMIMVTYAERSRLGLNTIGACDMTKDERLALAKEKKRTRDRLRQEQIRAKKGRRDRKSWEAESISTLKPWDVEEISRATWYRRKRETGSSRVEVISTNSDTLVSPLEIDMPPVPISPRQKMSVSSSKPTTRGLGTKSPTGPQGAAPHGSSDPEVVKAA